MKFLLEDYFWVGLKVYQKRTFKKVKIIKIIFESTKIINFSICLAEQSDTNHSENNNRVCREPINLAPFIISCNQSSASREKEGRDRGSGG